MAPPAVRAAAVDEAEPETAAKDDLAFWQLLLAGELSMRKARAISDELAENPSRVSLLSSHEALTEAERRRMLSATKEVLPDAQLLLRGAMPEALREADGPPAIFARGELSALTFPCVGIVGTRSASAYGRACAQKFGEGLARAGVTVVSGGALGIDAAAHTGALAVGGRTVAVLAGGVDNIYPSVHSGLFSRIRESGCLVSQFACGARPGEHKFLLRNDLIAAICSAIIVIEAPHKSGALRTATAAADLGREVFVVPAAIDNRSYWGSFNLLRDGATLVYHPDQVLLSLGIEPATAPLIAPPQGDAERIADVLGNDPLDPEQIVERTGLDPSTVLSELTLLEIDGRVLRHAGGYVLKP